jgi:hypothetical protein
MKPIQSLFLLLILALIPLLIWGQGQEVATAVSANLPRVGCNRIYLPTIINGVDPISNANDMAAVFAQNTPECAGFPDFNGDGYADLVIGAPRKGNFDTGIVQVVYGSAVGLNAGDGAVLDDQVWARLGAEQDDYYGAAIAMGDFNGDGYDDLAVGIPGTEVDGLVSAGAVQVRLGSADGLRSDIAFLQELNATNVSLPAGTAQANAEFGASLAVGDFDGNGYDDLAIGIPRANVDGVTYAGAVRIVYGYSFGLGTSSASELITQNTTGFGFSTAEFDDRFGFALAVGDFNGDGVDDLAVGTPYEDNDGGFGDAGAVQIFHGQAGENDSTSGLIAFGSVNNAQEWRSGLPNVHGAHEANDRFGWSLAVGDFDGDGYDDIAVGIPYETHGEGGGALTNGGAMNVIMGSANGLEATAEKPARLWHQDVTGMAGAVASLDAFGWALSAADFNNDGYTDLAIGVPLDQPAATNTGAVQIMFGSAAGLSATGNGRLYDNANPEAPDYFGWALTTADFNGDGYADVAVGSVVDVPTGVAGSNIGSVFTFYSDTTGPLQTEMANWYPSFNGLKGSPIADDFFGGVLPGSPMRGN